MPLPPGTTVCPRCHTAHAVVSEVNPLQLPADMTDNYIQFFRSQTESNPKDTNALFGMGLVYLGLKNYELAQRNFKQAVDLSPLEPDMYYYFALSLFEGHNPKHLKTDVTDRIEEWLRTAVNRQAKRKYLILQMVLRQGAFVANGLQVHGEQPAELMERIRQMMPEPGEVGEIKAHVRITDEQTLEWLNELSTGKRAHKEEKEALFVGDRSMDEMLVEQVHCNVDFAADATERDEYFFYDGSETNTVHHVAPLLDEQKRDAFFRYQYPPQTPLYNKLPFPPIFRALLMTVGYFVLWIVMAFVVEVAHIGYAEMKVPERPAILLKGEKAQKQQPKTYQKALKEQEQNDEAVQAFFAEHWVWGYKEYISGDCPGAQASSPADATTDDPEEVEHSAVRLIREPLDASRDVAVYYAFEKSGKGIAGIALFLLPVLLYIIRLLWVFIANARDRKDARRCNKELRDDYDHAKQMCATRATKLEYIAFCRNYLAQRSRCLPETGDPVSLALKQNHIDEDDMKGKILFVNYFEDTDHEDCPTDNPLIVLRHIYYVIAVPQKDKLVMMKNCWDTLYNRFDRCDVEYIPYKSICSLEPRQDEIAIVLNNGEEKGIVLSPVQVSIFEYQNTDPQETDTYSTTRTSNPDDFIQALNALL